MMLLAIVHNNEPERLAHLRPAFSDIQSALKAVSIEVSEQDTVAPVSYVAAVKRLFMYQVLERRWFSYQHDLPFRSVFLRWKDPYTWIRFLFLARGYELRRRFAIATLVSKKHIQAWQALIGGDERFVLVAESDAVVLDDSKERLLALRDRLPPDDRLLYVDLAGGMSHELLGLKKMIVREDNGILVLDRTATNTACSYIISKSLARRFQEIMRSRPWFEDVAIDWLINALFLQIVGKDRVECWHAHPTIFRHGSAAGEYQSSLR